MNLLQKGIYLSSKFYSNFLCYHTIQKVERSIWRHFLKCSRAISTTTSELKSNKERKFKFDSYNIELIPPFLIKTIEQYEKLIKEKRDKILALKEDGASNVEIQNAVDALKIEKQVLESTVLELMPDDNFDRDKLSKVLDTHFFFTKSFSIYGGASGQFDYGPLGCSIIGYIINEWEKFFVEQDNMLKMQCSLLTPKPVLEASGHVKKFTEYVVKDISTKEIYRVDHLLKQTLGEMLSHTKDINKSELKKELQLLDALSKDELMVLMKKYNVRAPSTGNELSDPEEINLMFPVSVGRAEGQKSSFLRPETSQGLFVNFKKLYYFNNTKLPLISAQVGTAYRNEITPKAGLLRSNEFIMAEIAHFCLPEEKNYYKFQEEAETKLWFYSSAAQMEGSVPDYITVGEALASGIISSETLGYYLARIQKFLVKIGLDETKLRFRQHLKNEMAHYASDCWDVEALTSYGWVECVGCADRSAYDLERHSQATGIKLAVPRNLEQLNCIGETLVPVVKKDQMVKHFGSSAAMVTDLISNMTEETLEKMEEMLSTKGSFDLQNVGILTRSMIPKIVKKKGKVTEDVFPCVIEPSFGISRIFYTLLEHKFRIRKDNRTYFSFPPRVAPYKVSIFTVVKSEEFEPCCIELCNCLKDSGITCKYSFSKTRIGKKYVNADSMGIPYCVTIDSETIDSSTVTLRERDTRQQIRISIRDAVQVLADLSSEKLTWNDITLKYPLVKDQF